MASEDPMGDRVCRKYKGAGTGVPTRNKQRRSDEARCVVKLGKELAVLVLGRHAVAVREVAFVVPFKTEVNLVFSTPATYPTEGKDTHALASPSFATLGR